jgi:integrase
MPLTLRPPRKGKSPNYEIRGTYLGVAVERSAGTPDKKLALKVLNRVKSEIEEGKIKGGDGTTFLMTVKAYLEAGGEGKFMRPIIELDGEHSLCNRLVADIDQTLLDLAAAALYPNATPQTRNRKFYTPVSAVLKRAGIEWRIKRPKGWAGKKSKWWLLPEQAFALIAAAAAIDAEFGLLCLMLLYTGMRISEALDAKLRHLNLNTENPSLYLPETKNSEARSVYLPPIVIEALRAMPPRPTRIGGMSQSDAGVPFLKRDPDAKLFRFHRGSFLRKMLARAMDDAGLSFPPRYRGFHLFCHTYASWMVGINKMDNYALARTGRWKDPRSTAGYVHTHVSQEAIQAANLPVPAHAIDLGKIWGKTKTADASR